MKPRILVLITVMTILAALTVPDQLQVHGQSQQQLYYTATDLGTLGGTFSFAQGLNHKGWVVGFSTLPGDTNQHAFLWREGMMTDLGTLGGLNSGLGFWGEKPNERGQIAGATQTSALDPLGEDFCGTVSDFGPTGKFICLPFVWQNGVMTSLPTLGGNNGVANSINNRDQVAGAAENATPPDPSCVGLSRPKPVLWEEGVIQELPTFPGDLFGGVDAINDNGQATGISVNNCIPSVSHALVWQNGRLIDLGNLGGNFFDEGADINNQGQVVGFSSLPGDTTFHAFLWTEDNGMQDVGTLPGDAASFAPGINDKGQVVGTSCADPSCMSSRAFLWQNGMMTDLNTLIPTSSPLFLLEAFKINARGQIVGLAFDTSTGEFHAFLATPSNEDVASAASVAQRQTSQRPRVVLPENVRKLLRQRRFGRFGAPLTRPQ
jgi:probable HAF family extracellular repeat protein